MLWLFVSRSLLASCRCSATPHIVIVVVSCARSLAFSSATHYSPTTSLLTMYGSIVVIKRNGKDGGVYEIDEEHITFGRDEGCNIRLQLPTVSKMHASLHVDALDYTVRTSLARAFLATPRSCSRYRHRQQVWLENESQTHATFLNDKTVGDTAIEVHDGDVISIVDRRFRYLAPEQKPEPALVARSSDASRQSLTLYPDGRIETTTMPRLRESNAQRIAVPYKSPARASLASFVPPPQSPFTMAPSTPLAAARRQIRRAHV